MRDHLRDEFESALVRAILERCDRSGVDPNVPIFDLVSEDQFEQILTDVFTARPELMRAISPDEFSRLPVTVKGS